jgi:hypothetical protein
MMSRKERMLTRAMLLEEVWVYKFVPRPTSSTFIWGGCGARWTSRPNRR